MIPPWMRETLRWLLIIEILMQPIICVWLVVIAMRIRRDQEQICLFLKVWGDRLLTPTAVTVIQPKIEP